MNLDRIPQVEKSLLIVHQGALGDFIVTFPVLKALRVSFSRVDAICRASFGQLAVEVGVLDRHHPLESARVSSLYANRIDPEMSQLVSAYSHILLISFSAILEFSMKKINADRVFRIEPWPEETHRLQVTEFLANRTQKCGILSSGERDKFYRTFCAAAQSRPTKLPVGATLILSPGAGSIKKRWPLERFLVVAAKLLSQGMRLVMLLGPAESDIEVALKQRRETQPGVVKCTSFPELIDILNSADGYIGNDSGISHLAAFLGLPTLVIFGPSDSVRWRPFGDNVRVVTPSEICCPCTNTASTGYFEPALLRQITPDRVLAEWHCAFGAGSG